MVECSNGLVLFVVVLESVFVEMCMLLLMMGYGKSFVRFVLNVWDFPLCSSFIFRIVYYANWIRTCWTATYTIQNVIVLRSDKLSRMFRMGIFYYVFVGKENRAYKIILLKIYIAFTIWILRYNRNNKYT